MGILKKIEKINKNLNIFDKNLNKNIKKKLLNNY